MSYYRKPWPTATSRNGGLLVPKPGDVFIAVMGMTGAGKSTFISHCTDEQVAISTPGALESCTQEVSVHRCNYFSPSADVWLVDTPGFDDTNRKDTDILKEIAGWLTSTYNEQIRLRGILYLHRISDNRMGGCAARNLTMFKKLCGHEGIKNVTFVTNFWEGVDESVGKTREKELKIKDEYWGFFISRGAKIQRNRNTRDSALKIIQSFVPGANSKAPSEVKLAIQAEMVEQEMTLDETSAGQELETEIRKERDKLKQEMKEMEEEMKEAMKVHDQELMDRLRNEQEKQNALLRRREKDVQNLKVSMERIHEEKIKQLEARIAKQQSEYQEEQRRDAAKNQQTIDEMNRRHQNELRQLSAQVSQISQISLSVDSNSSDEPNWHKYGHHQTCRSCGQEHRRKRCRLCGKEYLHIEYLVHHLDTQHDQLPIPIPS